MNDYPEVVLDLSRLISRMRHPTPTGVDRCEMAYARGLWHAIPQKISFAAVNPLGIYGRLHTNAALRFMDAIERRWAMGGASAGAESVKWVLSTATALRPRRTPPAAGMRVYVQASPHHLTRERLVGSILRREHARLLCLVHDLIPIEFPEYARVETRRQHERRVHTIVGHAQAIISNSSATSRSLEPWIRASGRNPLRAVAHLGVNDDVENIRRASSPYGGKPYFVILGTIEPRKNHLLLLNIWRRMAERRGDERIPKLIVIGKRGWENEQIVDMLDRCPALQMCVEEHKSLSDAAVGDFMRGARALLMPSFAEGYGLPVSEALASGVPVICSDLPALREAGGDVPEFLDPLDGARWMALIDDYTSSESTMRSAQIERMKGRSFPKWTAHLAIVLDLLHRLNR